MDRPPGTVAPASLVASPSYVRAVRPALCAARAAPPCGGRGRLGVLPLVPAAAPGRSRHHGAAGARSGGVGCASLDENECFAALLRQVRGERLHHLQALLALVVLVGVEEPFSE